jgi:ribulose-5-phosphate 4-epimerase/fuculose-1-phosphate aldolase
LRNAALAATAACTLATGAQAADWSDPKRPPFHGFLLSGHGLYTWGRDLAEARRQIEIHEFLFEVVARTRTFAVAGAATTPIAPAASIPPQSIQVGTERTVPAAARHQQTAQHQQ